jgi:hypothetical protein
MKPALCVAVAIFGLPMGAMAMPSIGDMVGTNPTDATAALKEAGCAVYAFEAEDGMIEAKCTEVETNKAWEIYIDPANGQIKNIKSDD